MIRESDACMILTEMADYPDYEHQSERKVRHGYMGFVVKLANLI